MRVDFYHLEKVPLDAALPMLLQKAYETGQHILIKVDMAERADYLNSLLWTYQSDSFLPHGVEKDGNAEEQPIFITHKDNYNPNASSLVVLVDNMPVPLDENFTRALYFFDGRNPDALQKARSEWQRVTAAGAERFYWQQNETGRWENKG